MKLLCEKVVYTNEYAGTIDLLTGFEDFKSEVEFDGEWHTYKKDGKNLPSVTQILDDGKYDNPHILPEVLKYAQNKGTLVHKEIQEYLETQKEGFTEEFYEFKRLFTENKKLFEDKAIFDFKTYATASLDNREKCYKQTKMYAEAVRYLTGEEPKRLYLVHLPHGKKGKIYDLENEFGGNKK